MVLPRRRRRVRGTYRTGTTRSTTCTRDAPHKQLMFKVILQQDEHSIIGAMQNLRSNFIRLSFAPGGGAPTFGVRSLLSSLVLLRPYCPTWEVACSRCIQLMRRCWTSDIGASVELPPGASRRRNAIRFAPPHPPHMQIICISNDATCDGSVSAALTPATLIATSQRRGMGCRTSSRRLRCLRLPHRRV